MNTQFRPWDVYNNDTARFNGGRALTEDEMHRVAPSIFASEAHSSRSDRFTPVPTIELLRALQKEGFSPVAVKQGKTRVPGKADFTKHLIRLRRLDSAVVVSKGDTVVEALLKNANDGTSAYSLMAGLFRVQCLNSLVCQTATIDEVKVGHIGQIQDKIIEGTYRVIGEAQKALAAPDAWSQQRLNEDERQAFARAAHVLRFADAEGEVTTPIRPDQLLRTRRPEDREAHLWNTLNVVQENVIRGGLHAVGRDANNRRRNVTTRAVNGIDQDVKLNKALWVLAEEMARIKAAA